MIALSATRGDDRRIPFWRFALVLVLILVGACRLFAANIKAPKTSKLAPPGTAVVVLLFVASDCPISDRYQPEFTRLSKAFEGRSVKFWMVYPNPSETQAGVELHQKQFSQSVPPLLDPEQKLVKMARVHATPEAAVFVAGPEGLREVYSGRIDDRYLGLGKQRPQARHLDLTDAIEAALKGQPVHPAAGKAVGCSIIPLR